MENQHLWRGRLRRPSHQLPLSPRPTIPATTIPATATTALGRTTTTPAGTALPACHNGQISVSGAGGGAGLGHQDQVILFTNQSSSMCALSGYPGVAGLEAQGDQAVPARRTLGGYMGGLPPGAAVTPPNVSWRRGRQRQRRSKERTIRLDPPHPAPTTRPSSSLHPSDRIGTNNRFGIGHRRTLRVQPDRGPPVVPGTSGDAD